MFRFHNILFPLLQARLCKKEKSCRKGEAEKAQGENIQRPGFTGRVQKKGKGKVREKSK